MVEQIYSIDLRRFIKGIETVRLYLLESNNSVPLGSDICMHLYMSSYDI